MVAMSDHESPLRPASRAAGPVPLGPWMVAHTFGLLALAIGAVAFVVVTLQQDAVWATPDWRITVPFFTAALVVGVVALARREGPLLPLAGVGLAAIALVLGWFLVMAIIVAVVAALILILSVVM